MEYFVIRNLGYDGLIISKFKTKEEAEAYYSKEKEEMNKWVEKYGDEEADKGIAMIEGNIIKIEDMVID